MSNSNLIAILSLCLIGACIVQIFVLIKQNSMIKKLENMLRNQQGKG